LRSPGIGRPDGRAATTSPSLLVTRHLQRQSGAIFPKPTCIWRSDERDRNTGALHLSTEAALVAASRATDSTELFVLTEPDETLSPGDGDEELGRAWSRSEQQRLALDELETGAEIARLAGTPREALGYERDTLVSLIGAGPAVDLKTRQADATRELGISLVPARRGA
jgi:hypothetical protein